MELLTDVTYGNYGSFSNVNVIIGCVFSKSIDNVKPLISGNLNCSYMRDHVSSRFDDE